MADFRESGTVIREADLLAGTLETAADWIRQSAFEQAAKSLTIDGAFIESTVCPRTWLSLAGN